MTTDPNIAFHLAKDQAVEDRWGNRGNLGSILERNAFRAGAVWARDHLAAQEPTDDEVEAAAASISACDQIDFADLLRRNHGLAQQYRRQARAALYAARTMAVNARAIRPDEEKRDG